MSETLRKMMSGLENGDNKFSISWNESESQISLTVIVLPNTSSHALVLYPERERENKTHSCMWAGRYTYTHTSPWSQHTKGTCAYKHTQVKVQTDRGKWQRLPSRADNYNQGINSQTLRRFSSKAQPLGFQRVLKWASTDQYLMVDYKGKCWDKIKMKSKQNKQTKYPNNKNLKPQTKPKWWIHLGQGFCRTVTSSRTCSSCTKFQKLPHTYPTCIYFVHLSTSPVSRVKQLWLGT